MTADNVRGAKAWIWPAIFCGYFAAQAVYRWLIGGGLGLDESELFLAADHLSWGYGPQPPLYAWLQWALFQVIGDPLLALSLLKNALLCTTYLAVYTLLRSSVAPMHAGLATLGLILLPQIGWESQRALSHSVLATAMAALTCLVFWTQVLRERRGAYALFGLLLGLGLISKANYALVPPALCVAAATIPELRRKLRPLGLAVSAAIAAAIAAGPLLWVLRNRDLAMSSLGKLDIAETGMPVWQTALASAAALGEAALAFAALPLVVAGLIVWRCRDRANPAPPASPVSLEVFLTRAILIGLGLTLILAVASGAGQVKDRWLQPVLFLFGPLIGMWLLARVTPRGRIWWGRVAATCALLVTIMLPVELVTGTPGNPARGGAPIEAIGEDLAASYPEIATVVGDPEWVAANLQYRKPDLQVTPAHSARLAAGETALLIWMDEAARGSRLATRIGERSGGTLELDETATFSHPYPWQPDVAFTLNAATLHRPE
ncbi:MAG: glycosyltransferase family 39 protein [Pseudomonadota bacterium]